MPKRGTEIAFQVMSCRGIFENGSLPLILGKTTRLPVNRTMKEPRRGSLKARCSRNGNYLDEILFFGYTGNVSHYPALTFRKRLIALSFRSRRGQERALVR